MTVMIDNRWQMVTCKDCGKHYRCTPMHDYSNATTDSDGVCDTCLVIAAGLHPDDIVYVAGDPRVSRGVFGDNRKGGVE